MTEDISKLGHEDLIDSFVRSSGNVGARRTDARAWSAQQEQYLSEIKGRMSRETHLADLVGLSAYDFSSQGKDGSFLDNPHYQELRGEMLLYMS